MKRTLSLICAILAFYMMYTSIRDMDAADTWLEFFRGLFWLVAAGFAFNAWVSNVKTNEWPWQ